MSAWKGRNDYDDNSVCTSNSKQLDLKHNDEAFATLANVILDGDRNIVGGGVLFSSSTLSSSFIEAVQFRLDLITLYPDAEHDSKGISDLVRELADRLGMIGLGNRAKHQMNSGGDCDGDGKYMAPLPPVVTTNNLDSYLRPMKNNLDPISPLSVYTSATNETGRYSHMFNEETRKRVGGHNEKYQTDQAATYDVNSYSSSLGKHSFSANNAATNGISSKSILSRHHDDVYDARDDTAENYVSEMSRDGITAENMTRSQPADFAGSLYTIQESRSAKGRNERIMSYNASASRESVGYGYNVSSEAQQIHEQSVARQQIMEEIRKTYDAMRLSTDQASLELHQRHLGELQKSLDNMMMNLKAGQLGNNNIAPLIQNNGNEQLQGAPAMGNNAPQVKTHAPEPLQDHAQKGKGVANVVCVTAPATLPENFTFQATLDGKSFMATVPKGGVKVGEVFSCEQKQINGHGAGFTPVVNPEISVRSINEHQSTTNLGQWKINIFECFKNGVCHPLLLNSSFCPQVALAQIMMRMKLNWNGLPGKAVQTKTTFLSMTTMAACVASLNVVLLFLPPSEYGGISLLQMGSFFVVNATYFIYLIFAIAATRTFIRTKYSIPERQCVGCEDICLSCWLPCCTIAQMGDQTADFDTYRGACCSEIGLSKKADILLPAGGG